jgi:hypothetical protein
MHLVQDLHTAIEPDLWQVLLLSRLHHKNLVWLEGFCEENRLQACYFFPSNDASTHPSIHASQFWFQEAKPQIYWSSERSSLKVFANTIFHPYKLQEKER